MAYSPQQLQQIARRAAAKYGVPEEGFLAQIGQESGWRADARSPAGALGVAQFMPGTARGLGIDPMDPAQALDASARHMSDLAKKYGGWRNALIAYNAGPGRVGKPLFAETRAYVDKLLPSYQGGTPRSPSPATAPANEPLGGAPAGAWGLSQAGSDAIDTYMETSAAQALSGVAPDDPWGTVDAIDRALVAPPQHASPSKAPSAPVPAPAFAASPGKLAPHGGWGGAKGPLLYLTNTFGNGLTVSSEKRARRMTASGGVSDHWEGSKDSYARDLAWGGSQPVPQADKAASQIVAALGGPPDWGKTGGNFKTTINGIRWQVIYRSNDGGNHFNHIHVGARRVR